MATEVPAALKSADVTKFAVRAAQIEKAKPAVAYWCYYWVVKQVVTKGLHNVNDETKAYTTALMDKLEEMKTSHPNDDAITDDVAGQAIVEQFGLEVFQRASNTMNARKATRQTADTLQAAATFLEILNNWPPLDTEVAAKIKSAKYHALRILHAIRAGDDPNITDQVEQTAPDEPIQNVSAGNGDVSPLAPSPSRPSSGGYFPRTDPNLASELDRQGPSAPPPFIDQVSPIDHPHMSQPTSPNFPVHQPHPQPPPYSGFSPQYSPAPPQVPYQPPAAAPMAPYGQPSLPPAVPQYSAPPPMPPTSAVDEEAITLAQKHAKWAISALNFDDVSTAIRELRLALQALGAR